MTAGLLITFREGLEAFLVVGIILSYLGRYNLKKYNKWVYLGAFLGLISAFAMGILFQIYYSGFESKLSELYFKIGIMGLAIVVLTYMVLWMSKNSRSIKGDVEKNLERAVSAGSVFALILMGYLAILREGFETVLFMGAVFGDSMRSSVLYGGMAGLFLALAVTVAIFRGMRNLPIKTFFKTTGMLIILISAGLLSNMIGVMQDIEMMPVIYAGMFDLSWFMVDSSEVGIFFKALFGYTHSPSLLQLGSYLSYFTFVTWLLFRTEGRQVKPKVLKDAIAI